MRSAFLHGWLRQVLLSSDCEPPLTSNTDHSTSSLVPMSLCSRPRTIDNVAHQEEVISTLTRALETANVRTDQFCAAVCFAALLHRAGVLVVTALTGTCCGKSLPIRMFTVGLTLCRCRTCSSTDHQAQARPQQRLPSDDSYSGLCIPQRLHAI